MKGVALKNTNVNKQWFLVFLFVLLQMHVSFGLDQYDVRLTQNIDVFQIWTNRFAFSHENIRSLKVGFLEEPYRKNVIEKIWVWLDESIQWKMNLF